MGRKRLVFKFFFGMGLLLWAALGLYRYLVDDENNQCEMTYMFEYPQYIKINLNPEIKSLYQDYSLHVYGEGEQAVRYHKNQFHGIPVLYIPGNSASHQQASVAYRKALDLKKNVQFDFFTIDFNEELSAFSGSILMRHTSFTQKCIQSILQLYPDHKESPKSIVLIGHSMGGIIARAVFGEENFDSSSVQTIITLAAPHRNPIVALDEDLMNVYRLVDLLWSESSNSTSHVTLASIGGAHRDIQVRSGLTAVRQPFISVLTTEIPGVWLSVDHLCVVWCKQIVKVVVRALFDMVDPTTLQLTENQDQRQKVLEYHFVKRYAGKAYSRVAKQPPVAIFDPDGNWREVIVKNLRMHMDERRPHTNTYLMIPLVDNPHRDRVMIVASNLAVSHWVFGCVATSWRHNTRYCDKGVDLSDQTVLIPPTEDNVKRKLVNLDLAQLKIDRFSHVIINIPKNQEKAIIQFDVHRSPERNVEFPSEPWRVSSVSLSIPADVLVYNLTLPELRHSWHSLRLTATPSESCAVNESSALIRKVVPWSREAQFYRVKHSFSIQLHSPKTWAYHNQLQQAVHLQLLNFHQCRYEITISTDWSGIASQLVLFYWPCLLPLVVGIFTDCFSRQLAAKGRGCSVPSTLRCLLDTSLVRTALIPELVAITLTALKSSNLSFVPVTDGSLLRAQGLHLPLLYLILGPLAWLVALALAAIFWLAVLAGGTALHSQMIRYLRSGLGISTLIAELVAMNLARVPLFVSVAMVSVALGTCGSVALLIGCFFCVLKMFAYYENQLESAILNEIDDDGTEDADDSEIQAETEECFYLNTTVSLMWICTTLLCLPTLIVWIKNLHATLPKDPSLGVSIAWSVFGMVIWRKKRLSPKGLTSYRRLAIAVWTLSILQLVYGLFSVYRVKYFVTAAMVLHAANQLF